MGIRPWPMKPYILNADCLVALKELPDNSVDLIVTDPPYGMSFMGKDWDKAVPSVEIWSECLRVLKPGAFAFVMCIPRQDCLAHMVVNLGDAGFETGFTSMYWTYASGFPKAGNIGKQVDKRMGAEREVVGKGISGKPQTHNGSYQMAQQEDNTFGGEYNITAPSTPEAKALDGSYAGFQPKPAVEVILCVMKPLDKKTYVEQALDNGKGITWLDDCRVPLSDVEPNATWRASPSKDNLNEYTSFKTGSFGEQNPQGRFPANLLVSDDVLNDGVDHIGWTGQRHITEFNPYGGNSLNDSKTERQGKFAGYDGHGSFSRYFNLDAWYNKTFPFFITPKASKSEKNKGCEGLEASNNMRVNAPRLSEVDKHKTVHQNNHPTCKPVKLMCYLITLGSRQNDVILDPFMGSGTTGVACNMTSREFIGMEISEDYFKIAAKRCSQMVMEF